MASRVEQTLSAASVVVIGAFNPAIIHPAWLKANNVMGDVEFDYESDDKAPVVFRDFAKITAPDDGWELQVHRDKLQVNSRQEPVVVVFDMAISILQILGHTPLSAVGINRTVIFDVDKKANQQFGERLVPQGPWEFFLGKPGVATSDGSTGGLRQITMERPRDDGRSGYTRLSVSAPANLRLQIDVNDHFNLLKAGETVPASNGAELLQDCWLESVRMADTLIKSIRSYAFNAV